MPDIDAKEICLYHYFERSFGPFRPLTALPMKEARQILLEQRATGHFGNPDVEGFLRKRYERDEKLRDLFLAKGGKPDRVSPIYMMLGEHKQWESAYDEPAAVKIPLEEFDRLTVSFTYGDSFAVFDPTLFGDEEYWNRLYFADEILNVIARYGFPPYVEYNFQRGIYPKDKHINHHLKYVEAHVWNNEILSKYRSKWWDENAQLLHHFRLHIPIHYQHNTGDKKLCFVGRSGFCSCYPKQHNNIMRNCCMWHYSRFSIHWVSRLGQQSFVGWRWCHGNLWLQKAIN